MFDEHTWRSASRSFVFGSTFGSIDVFDRYIDEVGYTPFLRLEVSDDLGWFLDAARRTSPVESLMLSSFSRRDVNCLRNRLYYT